jgi:transposase
MISGDAVPPDRGICALKDLVFFVHATALERAGIIGLAEGQRVAVDMVEGRKGLQIRGLLLERGIVVPKGRRKLEVYLDELMRADPVSLSTRIRMMIVDMRLEWRELDRRISVLDDEFTEHARSDETACLLSTFPGIGVLNATALAAAIANAQTFKRGRDLAAWLGLVPIQMTTGGKPKLLGITKRGNVYLRKMIIHGARAALPSLSASATPIGTWLRSLRTRVHMNTAVVALANKLARIVWAVLRTGQAFNAGALVAAA